MRRVSRGMILCVLLLPAACGQSADSLVDEGFELIEQNRMVDAEQVFAKALHKQPEHLDAHRGMSWALLQQGRCKAALDSLRVVVKGDAEDADSWANLGYCSAELGDYSGAVAAYRQAARLEPGDLSLWQSIAEVTEDAKDYGALLATRVKLAELQPGSTQAQIQLADAYCLYGEFMRCEAVARDLIARTARNAAAQRILGVALQGQGRSADAARVFKEAVTLDPQLSDAWLRLASLYRGMGRDAEAAQAEASARGP